MSLFQYKTKENGDKTLRWSVWAFIVPFVLMWTAFSVFEVFPFGNNQTMVSDAWHQYYPFMVELRSKLLNGESLFYTWNNGLGINFRCFSL